MPLALVQLSDLHLKNGDEPFTNRINAIVNAVVALDPPKLEVIILWTGDLTHAGTASQFSSLSTFVDSLENAFKSNPNITLLGSAFIPGNHDCDFTTTNDARDPLIASLDSGLNALEPDGTIVNQVTGVQDKFFAFLDSRSNPHPNRLLWTSSFSSHEGPVCVNCLNTAWISALSEKDRRLLYPSQIIQHKMGALTIAILHHPLGWFAPDNAKDLRRALERDCHIIFTGHEHDADCYTRTGHSINTQYIEGGALHAPRSESAFNIALIESRAQDAKYTLYKFIWADDIYHQANKYTSAFVLHQRIVENTFQRTPEFERSLQEISTPYTHPRKTSLRLSDLFVYPDLKRVHIEAIEGPTQHGDTIRSEDTLEELASCALARICGSQKCGKSALAKNLCRDLLDLKGTVPLLLGSRDISTPEEDKLARKLDRAFSRSYGEDSLDHFKQLPKEHRAVIIDDWNTLRLNDQGKHHLLTYLTAKFGCVIALDNSSPFLNQLDAFLRPLEGISPRIYELGSFGHALRGELISRWQILGREEEVSDEDLAQDVTTSEKLISNLVGKGTVPSTPLFILSALQLQDDPSRAGTSYGAYGYIYQALITERLASRSPNNIPLQMAFLSAIASKMFNEKTVALTATQVSDVHRKYQETYNYYQVSLDQLLLELTASGLISSEAGEVRFEYRYAYYFFAASALKTAIDDEDNWMTTRHVLTELAANAAAEDNANILIFFLFLSKDRRLIREIISNSQRSFAATNACDLRQDVEFINAVTLESGIVEEPSLDLAGNRKRSRRLKDDAEEKNGLAPSAVSGTAMQSELWFALQSMEIMGQVLKNFPTDLKGDLKISLVTEIYRLAFCIMSVFLGGIQSQTGSLQSELVRVLSTETAFLKKSHEKQEKIVKSIIAFLSEGVIFGLIKKTSSLVGNNELGDTYDSVKRAAGPENIPTRIVDLSVRLDHFPAIPEAEIENLRELVRNNAVMYTILRFLVAEHLALFPVKDRRQRQRLVSLLGFSPSVGLGNKSRLLVEN